MTTARSTTSDAQLVEAVVRGDCEALSQLWSRYARTVHWVCALYEPDARLAHDQLLATFQQLWTSPLATLRAPSVPEYLTVTARERSRPAVHSVTTGRLDRLTSAQLASVALLFSGEFRADEVMCIVGCSCADLGSSIRMVLGSRAPEAAEH